MKITRNPFLFVHAYANKTIQELAQALRPFLGLTNDGLPYKVFTMDVHGQEAELPDVYTLYTNMDSPITWERIDVGPVYKISCPEFTGTTIGIIHCSTLPVGASFELYRSGGTVPYFQLIIRESNGAYASDDLYFNQFTLEFRTYYL